jgi:hypothetical protein
MSVVISTTDQHRAAEIFAKADEELTDVEREFLRRLAERWELDELDDEETA